MDSSSNSLAYSSLFPHRCLFFFFESAFWSECLFVFCVRATLKYVATQLEGTYINPQMFTHFSINKATSKQNQEAWVKFLIQQAVLKCSAHCTSTSISTAHESNLSVLSEGPGAPLFLLLGPIGLPGMLPALSPAFIFHISCATHHFPDDLGEGGKVMSHGTWLDPHGGRREEKRQGKTRRWWCWWAWAWTLLFWWLSFHLHLCTAPLSQSQQGCFWPDHPTQVGCTMKHYRYFTLACRWQ